MNCEKCQNKIEEGQKFCHNCGESINKINTKPEENISKIISKKNKTIKIGTIILIVVLSIILTTVILAIIGSGIEDPPEEDAINNPQETIGSQEQKPIQNNEIAELKKEIESLKSKTTTQTQNQKSVEKNISELKEELKSTNVVVSQNYDEQAGAVLDSMAKVFCSLENDSEITGSGSIWAVGEKYYLVTNKHVLEGADKENEICMITIARDWNAVSADPDKAYEDHNLLIYYIDTNYTFWDIAGFDFAIADIFEYEQSITFLDDIALETNEKECNETVEVGAKIKIIGFPYNGAELLPVITEGIISSFENIGDTPYYITSAKIERGNSGGVAVTDDYYCTIGIPSLVWVGESETLGRILMLTEKELKELFENM